MKVAKVEKGESGQIMLELISTLPEKGKGSSQAPYFHQRKKPPQIYALDVPESRKMCGRREDGIGMEAWGGAASASEGAGTSWGAPACSARRTGGGSASGEKLLLMIAMKVRERHRLSDSSAGETPTSRATSGWC